VARDGHGAHDAHGAHRLPARLIDHTSHVFGIDRRGNFPGHDNIDFVLERVCDRHLIGPRQEHDTGLQQLEHGYFVAIIANCIKLYGMRVLFRLCRHSAEPGRDQEQR
jgi:hypothetical protein